VDSTPFAIHFRCSLDAGQAPARLLYDDMPGLLGFNRIAFGAAAAARLQEDVANETFYLLNTDNAPDFNGLMGETAPADTRWRHSLHSDQAADLRGSVALVLDVDPLNSTQNASGSVSQRGAARMLPLGEYFGVLLVRDPACVGDRMYELTNNSFPIRQVFREGRARVEHLAVRLRRPDGTVVDLGGVDFHLTFRLTTWRVQAPKPVFARGS
jgi:hypothetical protein